MIATEDSDQEPSEQIHVAMSGENPQYEIWSPQPAGWTVADAEPSESGGNVQYEDGEVGSGHSSSPEQGMNQEAADSPIGHVAAAMSEGPSVAMGMEPGSEPEGSMSLPFVIQVPGAAIWTRG